MKREGVCPRPFKGFRRCLALLAAWSALLNGIPRLMAQEAEGAFVLEMSGRWHLVAKVPVGVQLHDRLQGGATIAADAPATACVLTLMLRDGNIVRRTCSPSAPCREPVRVPSTAESSPGFIANLGALWARITGQSAPRYVNTSARAMGPHEAVVPLRNGRIEFASAFAELAEGRYQVSLVPIHSSSSGSVPQRIEWDGVSAQAAASGVAPGLYALRVDASGEQTWVLVAAEKNFARPAAIFAEIDGKTRMWEGVPASIRSEFRRAALDQLAQEMESAQ